MELSVEAVLAVVFVTRDSAMLIGLVFDLLKLPP